MSTEWLSLLNEMSASDADLRRQLREWDPSRGSHKHLKRVKFRKGPFKEERYIDWQSVIDIRGSACVYKLPDPFLGLLYYDTILLPINPSPPEQFDLFHNFAWRDISRITDLARKGQVRLYLTDRPRDYEKCEYLQPLFDEFRPVHLVDASARIVEKSKVPFEIDTLSESTTDLPHIKGAIIRFANRNHIAFEVADATACYCIQEMYYRGQDRLAHFALDYLRLDPDAALEFIWALRRTIVDPLTRGPGMPFAFDKSECCRIYARTDVSLRMKNITPVPDVGKVVAKMLSFPTPNTWDELRWCQDNLDIPAIRRAFAIMEREAQQGLLRNGVSDIEATLSNAWEQKERSVSKLKGSVLWGTSLTVAVAGTFITGPVAGILSALGLTSAQNLWLESATAIVAKKAQPQAFHIWDVQRRLGRWNH